MGVLAASGSLGAVWKDVAPRLAASVTEFDQAGFTGRALSYLETMWDALNAESDDRMRLYLAEHEGDLVAATTMIVVGELYLHFYMGVWVEADLHVEGRRAIAAPVVGSLHQ